MNVLLPQRSPREPRDFAVIYRDFRSSAGAGRDIMRAMRPSLAALLATHRVLLADGATGTNYFKAGLTSGEPPEFWTTDRPEEVTKLHQQFVAAGADIILTNTFG